MYIVAQRKHQEEAMKTFVRIVLVFIFSVPLALAQSATQDAAASINQRGLGNRFSPTIRTGGAATVMGSQSYTYAVPMFSLPGRHGLNLDLSLVYNSLMWSRFLGTGGVIFDLD